MSRSSFMQKYMRLVGAAEHQIYMELLHRGVRVVSQKHMVYKWQGVYHSHPIDLVLLDYNLPVEVYGPKHDKRVERDAVINLEMQRQGYRIPYIVDLHDLGYDSGRLPKKVLDPLVEDILETAVYGRKENE